jgi:hypothetical protein
LSTLDAAVPPALLVVFSLPIPIPDMPDEVPSPLTLDIDYIKPDAEEPIILPTSI